ncbi:hypothetical protein JG687_00006320 [Phytophthora cactorum]|uniref:Uncharacterized protein n=1 Tax=Phytophthora cactorum TaxID=29920 RepID=A0A8T1ULD4_9STRA|nr:hypothetical protein JG687_00006320 [Phytophthora cactorum]
MTRKNASFPTISEKTLKLNLMCIFESAEGRFTEELPPSFGIQPTSELALVQQAFKKCKTSKRSLYGDVAFIPPTSNECEQFSRWPRWFTRTCGRGWVLRRWRC